MKRLNVGTILLCLLLLCAVMAIAARGEPQSQNGPSSVLPAPLPIPSPPPVPPQLLAPPSAPDATLAKPRGAIGSAEMDLNGAIRLHLWPPAEPIAGETFRPSVPWAFSQERIGYGEIEIERTDGVYMHLLKHLGGLHSGEIKSVPPWRVEEHWHCLIDPDRGPCPLEYLLQ
jgi:hypothetical protein